MKAVVLVASGVEDVETVSIIDVLRRGDIAVSVVSISETVKCAFGTVIVPDMHIDALGDEEWDAVILPGGSRAAELFSRDGKVHSLLKVTEQRGSVIAAICAAPTALVAAGIAPGRKATCYPSLHKQIEMHFQYRDERVVTDGNLITSQGPGTALDFAFVLLERLAGSDIRKRVASAMLIE